MNLQAKTLGLWRAWLEGQMLKSRPSIARAVEKGMAAGRFGRGRKWPVRGGYLSFYWRWGYQLGQDERRWLREKGQVRA